MAAISNLLTAQSGESVRTPTEENVSESGQVRNPESLPPPVSSLEINCVQPVPEDAFGHGNKVEEGMTLKNETVEVGGQLQMIVGKEVIELEPDEETFHQAANEEEICISRNEDDLANDPEVVALAIKKFYLDDLPS